MKDRRHLATESGIGVPTLAQLVDEELIAPTGTAGPCSDDQLTHAGRS